MKAKKAGLRIIYAIFIIVICLSWVFWFFLEKWTDTTNYEKRQKNTQPRLTLENYQQFPIEYNNYFNDNIPFRNNLVTLNNAIDYYIYRQSPNRDVVKGSDDWLFFSRVQDGDPIACYQGTNLLSDDELDIITENCVDQRDFLASQGIQFVILIAPNKERIYYDKMPSKYGPPAEEYRALQVVEDLREYTDLIVIYPYDELMAARGMIPENIYYKTDTHWNAIGAYVGSSELLRALGIEMPGLTSGRIQIKPTGGYPGDLAGFIGLAPQLKSTDREYQVSGYDTHQVQQLEGEGDDAPLYKYKATNADPRKIYIIRDSFGLAMRPYLSSQFSETVFRHRNSYSYEDLVSQKPDIVVYEVVERHVHTLKSFSIQ